MLKHKEICGDAIKGIYNAIHDTYCIMPRVSMVRNWGTDGSGVHSHSKNIKQNRFYSTQVISKDLHFDFSNDYFILEPTYLERKKNNFSTKKSIKRFITDIILDIDLFLFRKFNFIPRTKYI